MPADRRRMSPARSMSCWLTISASAGVSRRVVMGYWDSRIVWVFAAGGRKGLGILAGQEALDRRAARKAPGNERPLSPPAIEGFWLRAGLLPFLTNGIRPRNP